MISLKKIILTSVSLLIFPCFARTLDPIITSPAQAPLFKTHIYPTLLGLLYGNPKPPILVKTKGDAVCFYQYGFPIDIAPSHSNHLNLVPLDFSRKSFHKKDLKKIFPFYQALLDFKLDHKNPEDKLSSQEKAYLNAGIVIGGLAGYSISDGYFKGAQSFRETWKKSRSDINSLPFSDFISLHWPTKLRDSRFHKVLSLTSFIMIGYGAYQFGKPYIHAFLGQHALQESYKLGYINHNTLRFIEKNVLENPERFESIDSLSCQDLINL